MAQLILDSHAATLDAFKFTLGKLRKVVIYAAAIVVVTTGISTVVHSVSRVKLTKHISRRTELVVVAMRLGGMDVIVVSQDFTVRTCVPRAYPTLAAGLAALTPSTPRLVVLAGDYSLPAGTTVTLPNAVIDFSPEAEVSLTEPIRVAAGGVVISGLRARVPVCDDAVAVTHTAEAVPAPQLVDVQVVHTLTPLQRRLHAAVASAVAVAALVFVGVSWYSKASVSATTTHACIDLASSPDVTVAGGEDGCKITQRLSQAGRLVRNAVLPMVA